LKNLHVGEAGYGQRGDVLVSTLDDLLTVDIVVTHPASHSIRSQASREPGVAARVAAANKIRVNGAGATKTHFCSFCSGVLREVTSGCVALVAGLG
jgi:hypothetical protein